VQVALFSTETPSQLVAHDPVPAQVLHAEAAVLLQSGSTAPQPQSQPSPVPYLFSLHDH